MCGVCLSADYLCTAFAFVWRLPACGVCPSAVCLCTAFARACAPPRSGPGPRAPVCWSQEGQPKHAARRPHCTLPRAVDPAPRPGPGPVPRVRSSALMRSPLATSALRYSATTAALVAKRRDSTRATTCAPYAAAHVNMPVRPSPAAKVGRGRAGQGRAWWSRPPGTTRVIGQPVAVCRHGGASHCISSRQGTPLTRRCAGMQQDGRPTQPAGHRAHPHTPHTLLPGTCRTRAGHNTAKTKPSNHH
jgi:hypothetical protein